MKFCRMRGGGREKKRARADADGSGRDGREQRAWCGLTDVEATHGPLDALANSSLQLTSADSLSVIWMGVFACILFFIIYYYYFISLFLFSNVYYCGRCIVFIVVRYALMALQKE